MTRRTRANLLPFDHAPPDSHGMTALVADQHHVRDMDRSLALNDAGLLRRTPSLRVLLDHVDAFHHDPRLSGIGKSDLALLPSVLAAYHQNRIVLPNLHGFTAPPGPAR